MKPESELDGWRLCPRCGGPLGDEPRSVRCRACGLAVYGKPAPAVCALVEDGRGRILLGRRALEPRAGCWDVLGGFMEEGEQPFDTLRREIREETGLEVEPLEFVGAVSDRYGDGGGHTLNLCWTARATGGELRAADDVSELRWFTAHDLPEECELAFENSLELMRRWRRLRSSSKAELGMFEVQLVVREIGTMTAFYRELVELEVSLEDQTRGRTHFRTGRGQLILARAESEPDGCPDWPGLPPPLVEAEDRRGPTPLPHGPVHFAIEVPLGELLDRGERLRAGRTDVRGPFRWPGGRLSIYFRDPEGNIVELISGRAE